MNLPELLCAWRWSVLVTPPRQEVQHRLFSSHFEAYRGQTLEVLDEFYSEGLSSTLTLQPRGNYHSTYSDTLSCLNHAKGSYCIAGKFGGELNLVIWRTAWVITKLKSAKISYRTAKFKSANTFEMAIWDLTAKLNSRQYFQLYSIWICTSMTLCTNHWCSWGTLADRRTQGWAPSRPDRSCKCCSMC